MGQRRDTDGTKKRQRKMYIFMLLNQSDQVKREEQSQISLKNKGLLLWGILTFKFASIKVSIA